MRLTGDHDAESGAAVFHRPLGGLLDGSASAVPARSVLYDFELACTVSFGSLGPSDGDLGASL